MNQEAKVTINGREFKPGYDNSVYKTCKKTNDEERHDKYNGRKIGRRE